MKVFLGKLLKGAVCAGILSLCAITNANASLVMPVSYDMLNGGSSDHSYRDESYNGIGSTATNYAPLSGGLGDLTDGIIATNNWNIDYSLYVGWRKDWVIPTISFNFGAATLINSVTVYVDDPDGHGGVWAPVSVTIAGTNYLVTDPVGSTPFALTFTGLGLNVSDLDITIDQHSGSSWVMVSEITFGAGAVPVPIPATVWLFGSALGLLGWMRRKKA